MNKSQRKEIDKIILELETLREQMDDIKSRIETLKDEEQEKFDNLTEALQQNEKGQAIEAATNALETAFDAIDGFDFDDITSSLEEAVQ